MSTTTIQQKQGIAEQILSTKGISGQKAEIILAMDYSASMARRYQNGMVQRTMERFLGLGLAMDDNGKVDAMIFNDNITVLTPITQGNIADYVNREILSKGYRMDSGTKFAPVLGRVLNSFGGARIGNDTVAYEGKLGVIANLFGVRKKVYAVKPIASFQYPKFVIIVTDGENEDKADTEEALTILSNYGVFVQMIGLGEGSFSNLKKLDDLKNRMLDNANFFKAPNVDDVTDETFYKLIQSEFPIWVPLAKKEGLIK